MHRPHIIRVALLATFISVVASACGGATAIVSPAASVAVATQPASVAPASVAPASRPPVALTECPVRALPWDGKSPLDLTGVWSVDGHGMYYITQVGDAIWWIGLSGLDEPAVDAGKDWANAFKGTMTGIAIDGTYVDVPKGGSDLNGPVKLEIQRTPTGTATLVRTNPDSETEFGGMVFTPCTPTRS